MARKIRNSFQKEKNNSFARVYYRNWWSGFGSDTILTNRFALIKYLGPICGKSTDPNSEQARGLNFKPSLSIQNILEISSQKE
ncbi:MAG TPA: hypothetical protein HPP87_11020 [Planctomycetes bacterium]|nr:hypothetical protein [Planctomycetota bacterium]